MRCISGWLSSDRLGNALQHDRLARLGRRDDERALALADGRDEVEHPRDHLLVAVLELDAARSGSIEVRSCEVRQPRRAVERACRRPCSTRWMTPLWPAHLRLARAGTGPAAAAASAPGSSGSPRRPATGSRLLLQLPQEGVGALGLGVEHALHRGEGRLGRGLRASAAAALAAGARGAAPGRAAPCCACGCVLRLRGWLLLLGLTRRLLVLLQLLRREEDLLLLAVRAGDHAVGLTLRGEEHLGAPAAAAAAAAAASRLSGLAPRAARRGGRPRPRRGPRRPRHRHRPSSGGASARAATGDGGSRGSLLSVSLMSLRGEGAARSLEKSPRRRRARCGVLWDRGPARGPRDGPRRPGTNPPADRTADPWSLPPARASQDAWGDTTRGTPREPGEFRVSLSSFGRQRTRRV